MSLSKEYIFEAEGIFKSFDGIHALQGVDFHLKYNDVHALVGENGAGKSTFSKIVAGLYEIDKGKMLLENKPYAPKNRKEGTENGVCIIYQEPSLISSLSVAENMFLGRLGDYKNKAAIDWNFIYLETQKWLDRLNLKVNPKALVSDLSLGEQKLIELAKALASNPKVLIIDEATAVLNSSETKILFREINNFKEQGKSIIYISHYLEEIFEICSTVTVFKDGKVVTTVPIDTVNKEQLTFLMVGREIDTNYYRKQKGNYKSEVILEIKELSCKDKFADISFQLHPGEILGIGGLVGSGKEEVAETIFGLHRPDTGKIIINGEEKRVNHTSQAISSGIAYLPKERDKEGLILIYSICDNINLPILKRLKKHGFLQIKQERSNAGYYFKKLKIKARDINTASISLSGGNRQKIVIGKWLSCEPKILILNNPTRGIDVGVKSEVYALIQQLSEEGIAVLLISDELPELIGLSDRILIMRNGKVSACFDANNNDITEESLISFMV